EIPSFKSSIRLMDEESFYQTTGAPRWTNAMFYRGQIMIPISTSTPENFSELFRSVKHEYTHAVIHSLSAGKCPGWIDEGLAQWAEEKANPALKPALYRWLKKNDPVPLKLLQGGFTRLSHDMVPAAYAQSLFASNTIVETYGFEKLKEYFRYLRSDYGKEAAFKRAFGVSEHDFEELLSDELKFWAERYQASLQY
ncbi:MAG: hypothetical protein KDD62_09530, partial [Bdellovibrionales bacterium]|nr:hypothetical protein [Bdellovibrionales bacterium]